MIKFPQNINGKINKDSEKSAIDKTHYRDLQIIGIVKYILLYTIMMVFSW